MHQLLTVATVANRLAVSERTVAREVAIGALATIRVRGAVRIAESDLEAYIDRFRYAAASTTQTTASADSLCANERKELKW